jgi:hypothetical protein
MGAVGLAALVAFVWWMVARGRDDVRAAARWEVECRAAWAQRDAVRATLDATKAALAKLEAAHVELDRKHQAFVVGAVTHLPDDALVEAAGGDAPPRRRPSDDLMPFPEG